MNNFLKAMSEDIPMEKSAETAKVDNELKNKLAQISAGVVDSFIKNNGINLNQKIAEIASRENLNDNQIQRIIEDVNNQIYLYKYNQMKHLPERRVDFDLASLSKIKDIYQSKNVKVASVSFEKAASAEGGFDKVANYSSEMDFINTPTAEFGEVGFNYTADRERQLRRNIQRAMTNLNETIDKTASEVLNKAFDFAEVMVKMDKLGTDTQDIFERICKKASLEKEDQVLILEALPEKIAIMKEQLRVPDDYSLELKMVDIMEVKNDFSLGKFSLMKEAKEKEEMATPVVITDTVTVKSLNDLVDMAKSVAEKRLENKEARILKAQALAKGGVGNDSQKL